MKSTTCLDVRNVVNTTIILNKPVLGISTDIIAVIIVIIILVIAIIVVFMIFIWWLIKKRKTNTRYVIYVHIRTYVYAYLNTCNLM